MIYLQLFNDYLLIEFRSVNCKSLLSTIVFLFVIVNFYSSAGVHCFSSFQTILPIVFKALQGATQVPRVSNLLLYPYAAEGRKILGRTSPTNKRFLKAWEMSRGMSRGLRKISGSEGMCNQVHPDLRQCSAILSSLIRPSGCTKKYIPVGRLVL